MRTAGAATLCSIEDAAAPLFDSQISSLQPQGDANDDYAGNNGWDLLPSVLNQFFKTADPDLRYADGSPQIKQDDDDALPPLQLMHPRLDNEDYASSPQHERLDDDDVASLRQVKHRRLDNDHGKERSWRQDIQRKATMSPLDTSMNNELRPHLPSPLPPHHHLPRPHLPYPSPPYHRLPRPHWHQQKKTIVVVCGCTLNNKTLWVYFE